MLEILQWMFSHFFVWLGCIILITTLINGVDAIIRTIMHGMNVRKHGWPPLEEDCDCDENDKGTEDGN